MDSVAVKALLINRSVGNGDGGDNKVEKGENVEDEDLVLTRLEHAKINPSLDCILSRRECLKGHGHGGLLIISLLFRLSRQREKGAPDSCLSLPYVE